MTSPSAAQSRWAAIMMANRWIPEIASDGLDYYSSPSVENNFSSSQDKVGYEVYLYANARLVEGYWRRKQALLFR